VAALAGFLDDLADAAAGVAGAFDGEETLAGPDPAGAAAGRADHRMRALLAAAAVAGVACRRAPHPGGGLRAGARPVPTDRHVGAEIAAAPARLAAARAPRDLAEHLVEDVGEAGGGEIEAAEAATAGAAVLERGVPVAVIGGPLLVVLEDVIGLADFLE